METVDGLRERKKRRTREAIADTAWRLFLERGFDRVSVAEVARAADVSEATVFNYFPRKEDLAYHRMEDFEEELIGAIVDRAAGTSVVEAFGDFVLRPRGFLRAGGEDPNRDPVAMTRMFTESPALLSRERQIFDRYADRLVDLIAQERGEASGDLEPLVVARTLIGFHRALIDHIRRRVLAGASVAAIRREMSRAGPPAFELLRSGLEPAGG